MAEQTLTLIFIIHNPYLIIKFTISTKFQVTGCNNFHHCHIFPNKSLSCKICPCRKMGQGQPRVIIWTNYKRLESPMLHTKFRRNWSSGFWKKRFLKCFTIWAWQSSWSCDQHRVIFINFHFLVNSRTKFG